MLILQKEKQIIDLDLVTKRFKSVAKTYNSHALVQKNMARRLVDMSMHYLPGSFQNMLEFGCGTGILSNEILNRFMVGNYIFNDLVEDFEPLIDAICKPYSHTSFSFMAGDAAKIEIDQMQDVIWSGATVQWVSDLESLFTQIKNMLKPKGYFVFSTFGRFNYLQIKNLTGNGIEYKQLADILRIAEKEFNILDYQIWQENLWFNSPKEVLKHMQNTGVNAIRCEKWTKSKFLEFEKGYEKYKQDQGYPLTYHPVLFVLQTPDYMY